MSRPVANGLPADRICQKLKKSSSEICSVVYSGEQTWTCGLPPPHTRVKRLKVKLLCIAQPFFTQLVYWYNTMFVLLTILSLKVYA